MAQNPQQARLIHTARLVNDGKPLWVVDRVKAAVADCLAATDKRASEVKIACFGLAFKPNIDDLRESPAVEVAHLIAEWHVGETLAVEPNVEQLPKSLAGHVTLMPIAEALQQADVIVMLVDHQQFKAIRPEDVKQTWVIDTKASMALKRILVTGGAGFIGSAVVCGTSSRPPAIAWWWWIS